MLLSLLLELLFTSWYFLPACKPSRHVETAVPVRFGGQRTKSRQSPRDVQERASAREGALRWCDGTTRPLVRSVRTGTTRRALARCRSELWWKKSYALRPVYERESERAQAQRRQRARPYLEPVRQSAGRQACLLGWADNAG